MSASDETVQHSVAHGVATIVLNRPSALNSLNHAMVDRLSELLGEWSQGGAGGAAQAVACVVIKGTGGKAFCAGGDVKRVMEEAATGQHTESMRFFTSEYRLNQQIARYPLPYVALIDGIVMGGGAGVSVHGHFRVATERTVFAMPECAIGLFPDIGASSFLQRLPGRLGLWLGLTGARLKGVDVRSAGLATHYVPSGRLPEVERRLQQLGGRRAALSDLSEVSEVLGQLEAEAGPLPAGALEQQLPWINAHFAAPSVVGIVASLRARQQQLQGAAQQQQQQQTSAEASWLKETLQALAKGSPLSECITLEHFRRTRHLDLEECLDLDRKLVRRFCAGQADFVEGVRATLVDRGRQPVWKFATLEEVPEHVVMSFFDDKDLPQPQRSSTSSRL